jgi:iron complex transport system ATP-binding protein
VSIESAPATSDIDVSPNTGSHDLRTENATFAYGERAVIEALSLSIPAGRISVIVGANASGKSTLLRGLARLLRPTAGIVTLDGIPIGDLPSREVATRLGVLPQSPVAPEGIVVADLVGRGRYPHQGWFRRWKPTDNVAVEAALEATDTLDLVDRNVDELSGGQRQRVWIAMALAQETEILLLDEPTTFLDVSHQIDVLDLLSDLNQTRGTTIVIVLHDLNLAARYAHHMFTVRLGTLYSQGAPHEVVTETMVRAVFDLDAKVVTDEVTGTPLVLPIGRHRAWAVSPTGESGP